jgi:hypothetical protein
MVPIVIALRFATPAALKSVPAEKYLHGVCGALADWLDATYAVPKQVRAVADDFAAKKLTSAKARAKTTTIMTKAKKASDKLVTATKAAGVPQIEGGATVAADHRRVVGDVADVYQFLGTDFGNELKQVKDKELYSFLEFLSAEALDELDWAGKPLEGLQDDARLAPIVTADSACARVLKAYAVHYEPSGWAPGDCVSFETYKVVPCTAPHDGEVFLNASYPAGPGASYPGAVGINDFADKACTAAFASYVGVPVSQSKYSYIVMAPTASLWEAGDREIICVVGFADNGPTTGSVKGTAQ